MGISIGLLHLLFFFFWTDGFTIYILLHQHMSNSISIIAKLTITLSYVLRDEFYIWYIWVKPVIDIKINKIWPLLFIHKRYKTNLRTVMIIWPKSQHQDKTIQTRTSVGDRRKFQETAWTLYWLDIRAHISYIPYQIDSSINQCTSMYVHSFLKPQNDIWTVENIYIYIYNKKNQDIQRNFLLSFYLTICTFFLGNYNDFCSNHNINDYREFKSEYTRYFNLYT